MRILHVLHQLRPSGAEVMLKLAAPFWSKEGMELQILVLDAVEGEFAEPLRASGYIVHRLPMPTKLTLVGWAAAYCRLIRKIAPDVIHVHTEGMSIFVTTLPWFLHVPVIRTIHSSYPFKRLLSWQKTFERLVCRLLKCRHVAISRSVQENERTKFHNPTELCWNWFNDAILRLPSDEERRTARKRIGHLDTAFFLVSIGNGAWVKNYTSIVEALSLLPGRRVIYYQVGNESPGHEERLLCEKLNLNEQIVFTGPQSDIIPYLWAADAVIVSSFYEGLSIAAMEGLAANGRSIMTDVTGLKDYKLFDLNIVWCDPSPGSIANAIQKLLDANLDQSAIRKNSAIVREQFGVKLRCAAYSQIWWETIRHHSICERKRKI